MHENENIGLRGGHASLATPRSATDMYKYFPDFWPKTNGIKNA